MCGIFAYLNYEVPRDRRHVLEVLLNGLRRLEYRGYDSAGISVDADWEQAGSAESGKIAVVPPPLLFRQEGKIDNLETKVYTGMQAVPAAHQGLRPGPQCLYVLC